MSIGKQCEFYEPRGYALVFHPDLLHGTALGHHIQDYTFFSYKVNEALHISERERKIVMKCFSKTEFELRQGIGEHSKKPTNVLLMAYQMNPCQTGSFHRVEGVESVGFKTNFPANTAMSHSFTW